MKSLLSITITIIALVFLTNSCGIPKNEHESLKAKYDTLLKDNEILKNKLSTLEKKLDEIQFGADRLLLNSKNLFEKKDYQGAMEKLEILIQKHPLSNQAKEGESLRLKIDKILSSIKKENELAEKKRLATALANMRSSYDKVAKITFYNDKSTPNYLNYNSFHFYIGKKDSGDPWLVLKIQYTADDWLFIDKYIISTDKGNFEITPAYGEVKRDNGYGDIWEWYDDVNGDKYVNIAQAIIASKKPIIRYSGKDYFKDRTITEREKKALKNVLDAFDVLKK